MKDPRLLSFGQHVKELRKYSQEHLADLAGLDRSYMGHIERGEKNITLLKTYQVCGALEVDLATLFINL